MRPPGGGLGEGGLERPPRGRPAYCSPAGPGRRRGRRHRAAALPVAPRRRHLRAAAAGDGPRADDGVRRTRSTRPVPRLPRGRARAGSREDGGFATIVLHPFMLDGSARSAWRRCSTGSPRRPLGGALGRPLPRRRRAPRASDPSDFAGHDPRPDQLVRAKLLLGADRGDGLAQGLAGVVVGHPVQLAARLSSCPSASAGGSPRSRRPRRAAVGHLGEHLGGGADREPGAGTACQPSSWARSEIVSSPGPARL